jgi:hypothetical protein
MGGPVKADPCRLALSHAQGAIIDAGRLLKRCPDTAGLVEKLRVIAKEIGAKLEGMPLQNGLDLRAGGPEQAREPWLAAELTWRERECWALYLGCFRKWRERLNGSAPKKEPFFHPVDVQEPMRAALMLYDRALLEPEKREMWKQESRARAAGGGLFLSAWHTGEFPVRVRDGMVIGSGEPPENWHGPYVEPWRPWKKLKGHPDPVQRFSDAYFEYRESGGADPQ